MGTTVSSGQTTTQDASAALVRAALPGAIAGAVTKDVGGAGLSGVTISLSDANWNLLATAATTSSGTYTFGNLSPGVYNLSFSAPGGYVFDPSAAGVWSKCREPVKVEPFHVANWMRF